MGTIKKPEYFFLSFVLGIVVVGTFFKSITNALLIFTFGLFVQGYIFYGYKKNNLP